MEKVEKNIQKIDKVKINKIIEEIKNDISEKGFSVIELPNQRRLEFFYDIINIIEKTYEINEKKFRKKCEISGIIFFIISFILFLIGVYQETQNMIGTGYGFLVIFSILYFIFMIISSIKYQFLKYKTSKNIIKNNNLFLKSNGYLSKLGIVTEKNIFIDRKIYSFENEKIKKFIFLENSETYNFKTEFDLEDLILENPNYLFIDNKNQSEKIYKKYQKFNKKEKNLTILKENLDEIEGKIDGLNFLKNFIKENISKLKEGDFLSEKIFEDIDFFNKNINEIIDLKTKSENQLILLELENFINFEKFNSYIKKSILFPLNSLKEILKIQLNYCNYSLEKNKTSENPQIILANKRLEIQKNSLKEQILLLDDKIKKLEI